MDENDFNKKFTENADVERILAGEFKEDMSMYYTEFPDPAEVRKYSEEYNGKALKPMLTWVNKRVKDKEKMVQYAEVIAELEKFSPKYCCEMVFAKNVLLPELKDELPELPESLVVVLNTLHLVHQEGTQLVSVEKNGPNLSFTAEFKSWVDGKIVTDACSYKLRNYLSPEKTELEVQ
ncbi:MAG: hypothetical protein LBJ94_01715 [Puniceicoccales bacterium]|jgi:hypothetical protein|nr:hypothetical protein [Puniceicoccales bacterium]